MQGGRAGEGIVPDDSGGERADRGDVRAHRKTFPELLEVDPEREAELEGDLDPTTLQKQQSCTHERFEAEAIVGPRIADSSKMCVSLRVRCAICGLHFRFTGLKPGLLGGNEPSTPSYIGYAALLPIEPLSPVSSNVIDQADPIMGDPMIGDPKEVHDAS